MPPFDALTRSTSRKLLTSLAALGVEVVTADLDDQSSLEQAFKGAYGAYCVTNFWEHFPPERESQQARNLAAATREASGTPP